MAGQKNGRTFGAMNKEAFLVLMEARSLLRAEGFHPRNDRRVGSPSLPRSTMPTRILDRDQDFSNYYKMSPRSLEEALDAIDEAAERALRPR